jgi:hypothetical protein
LPIQGEICGLNQGPSTYETHQLEKVEKIGGKG